MSHLIEGLEQEISNLRLANSAHRKVRRSHLETIRKLRDELEEWDESFELYDGAMRRGTKIYQEATGRTRIWPDGAQLIAWLMERLEGWETIDPTALRMAADELPDTAEPRAAHLRRIAKLVEVKWSPDDELSQIS